MNEKKIKKIEYYGLHGKVEANMANEIFSSKIGLYKAEYFDTNGNIIRESEFDKNNEENRAVESIFNNVNNIHEKINFKRYSNQPLQKTYLTRYIYNEIGLLTEILSYYKTFDSSIFWAKNIIKYNEKKQKIQDDYTQFNDEPSKSTRIYDWKDEYNYVEDFINEEGEIIDRHFVELDKKGKELKHRINFKLSSKNDNTHQVSFEYQYDEYGNIITSVDNYKDKPSQKTVNKYLYEGECWFYKLSDVNGSSFWTEFRKIEYF